MAERPPLWLRIFVAVAIGAASAMVTHDILHGRHALAADFTWPWRAARALLAGQDPYVVIQPIGPYPLDDRLMYPLPAAIVSLPFALLPAVWAGALFIGCSAALLAFAVTRDGWHWMPLFVSAPFVKALLGAQWPPLLLAAALLPALQFVAAAKPNLGVVSLAYGPSRWGVIGCLTMLVVSLAILPSWPVEWLHNLGLDPKHPAPVRMFLGPLLLLAVLRWRTREGRLLLLMALVPQELLIYDQLALWLIPRRWWSSLLFSLLSWPALIAWAQPNLFGVGKEGIRSLTELLVMLCVYMPALYMVLRRPNDGPVPAWVDRRVGAIAGRVRAATAALRGA